MSAKANRHDAPRETTNEILSLRESCQLGVRRGTPLAISSGLFGILYGAACASLGISPLLAALSCVLVFSGAVQFAVIGMLSEPLALGAITVSSLLICNRLILMGVSIADHLRKQSMFGRILSMMVLTDGAWAATIAEKQPVDRFPFFVSAGLWILLLWVLGTFLGAVVAGSLSSDLIVSLRFAGVLFLGLLLLLVVKSTEIGHLPWIVSALTAFGASLILPLSLAFFIGVSVGAVIAWFGVAEGEENVD